MCALCRRNLLAGERYRHWDGADEAEQPRSARPVCFLCEDEAARTGWVRSERFVPMRESVMGLGATVRTV
jgi:hypothetical protein